MSALLKPDSEAYADIPDAMKAARRWLVWKLEPGKEKPRKVPYYASGKRRSGTLDSQEDMAQFASFEEATSALGTGRYTGLGFALGPDGTGNFWQGIDLDHISQHPHLAHLADDLPGYTETSPSGDGMHAIGYGRPFTSMKDDVLGIEAYAGGRYFTVTGEGAGIHEPVCIADFVETRLRPMVKRQQEPQPTASPAACEMLTPQQWQELRSALYSMRADDYKLWTEMGMRLKTLGDTGRGLWMAWSETSKKFDPAEAAEKWETFQPRPAGEKFSTSWRAVFSTAQEHGWVNPMKHYPQQSEPPEPFQLLTHAELATLPPLRWRIKHILPDAGLAAIYGPSGSGKSFLVLDMAFAIDAGGFWFNSKVLPGSVIYCALEGEGGIQKRVAAYQAAQGLEGSNVRYLVQPFNLLNSFDSAALAEAIGGIGGADVIILDTLNRAAPGANENDPEDMGRIITAAKELQRKFGGLVILVHHTGKDASRGMRGHSSLHAALDTAIEVTRENGIRQWQLAKSKDGEDGVAHTFRLDRVVLGEDEDSDEISSCVIVPEIDTAKAIKRVLPPKSGNQKIIWDELLKLFQQAGMAGGVEGAPKDVPLGKAAIRLDEAIDKTRNSLVVDEKRKTERTQSAITGLISKGLLVHRDGWIWQS